MQGERVSFTGILASMTHAQAADRVSEQGGQASEHISRQSTLLVVGEEGWPLEDDGHVSVKLQHAQKLQSEGVQVRILNESDWLYLMGLTHDTEQVRRLYTPAMLSSLLSLDVHVIRRWERVGLIRAVQRVGRLPYFDFREVSGIRRLAELLKAGVPRQEIETSLVELCKLRGVNDDPLRQLAILASDSHVLIRDAHGLKQPRSGQRVFDFEGLAAAPDLNADDHDISADHPHSLRFDAHRQTVQLPDGNWFTEGCRLADDGDVHDAIEAFRLALMTDASDPLIHFHLADCLYRTDNPHGALERYYTATELDHDYLEAWTQVGCIHRELGQLKLALDAFDIALDVHADYPDAHFHKAQTLHELGRRLEARHHWERYLTYDQRGPWADLARSRLSEPEA